MVYEETKDKIVYFYNVTYDKDKLSEILMKLEKYSYISVGHEQIAGSVTRWPVTKKNIQKRVESIFYSTKRHANDTLHTETITLHKDAFDFVSYEYSYEKMPDLYHYIDIVLNNKSILDYEKLFGFVTGKLDMFYAIERKEQLIIEGILNYINSFELINHHSKNESLINNERYDYKGLNELYKQVLECFNFNLIATKEYLDNQEAISGLSLQKNKKKS